MKDMKSFAPDDYPLVQGKPVFKSRWPVAPRRASKGMCHLVSRQPYLLQKQVAKA